MARMLVSARGNVDIQRGPSLINLLALDRPRESGPKARLVVNKPPCESGVSKERNCNLRLLMVIGGVQVVYNHVTGTVQHSKGVDDHTGDVEDRTLTCSGIPLGAIAGRGDVASGIGSIHGCVGLPPVLLGDQLKSGVIEKGSKSLGQDIESARHNEHRGETSHPQYVYWPSRFTTRLEVSPVNEESPESAFAVRDDRMRLWQEKLLSYCLRLGA
ncbi:predicted protein [Histoplasma capsulatum var. duboisii H88]|uniref:Predicted protein n=1 Tax=Ajellomyces capsulatus (strain H88) TaxID=544711 RepID=F0UAX2_AJEC8|nr:predicted protein [Histoplasma capsulatum var. duboisii H88]